MTKNMGCVLSGSAFHVVMIDAALVPQRQTFIIYNSHNFNRNLHKYIHFHRLTEAEDDEWVE